MAKLPIRTYFPCRQKVSKKETAGPAMYLSSSEDLPACIHRRTLRDILTYILLADQKTMVHQHQQPMKLPLRDLAWCILSVILTLFEFREAQL